MLLGMPLNSIPQSSILKITFNESDLWRWSRNMDVKLLADWLVESERYLAAMNRKIRGDESAFSVAFETAQRALEQAASFKKCSVSSIVQTLQSALITCEDDGTKNALRLILNSMVLQCQGAHELGKFNAPVILEPEQDFLSDSDVHAFHTLHNAKLLGLKIGRNRDELPFRTAVGRLIVWLMLRCCVPNLRTAVDLIKNGKLIYFDNQNFAHLDDEPCQRFALCDTSTLLLLRVRKHMLSLREVIDIRLCRLALKSYGLGIGLEHLTERQIIGCRKYQGAMQIGPVFSQLIVGAISSTELPNNVFHRLMTGQLGGDAGPLSLPMKDLPIKIQNSVCQPAQPVRSIDEINRIRQLKNSWLALFPKKRLGKASYKAICKEIEESLLTEPNLLARMMGYWLIAMMRNGGVKKSHLAASTITQYFSTIFQPAMNVFIDLDVRLLSESELLNKLQLIIDGVASPQQKNSSSISLSF
ncbi:hypothetical protein [Pseudobowmanella zhangzhouensis]|uniref:hypothetical protein n=1 Tax=Pseudobowmanella zhangzhouensis TaxID=1537679 RepID=UPI00366AE9C6